MTQGAHLLFGLFLILLPDGISLFADAGVLIPISEKDVPDAKLLSLDRMEVSIRIDNQYVHTRIVQVFESHIDKMLEGKFVFDLPAGALISDFAVWDGVIRIPGVILERRRARDLYQVLRQRAIDPGLLQEGQGDEPGISTRFSARIAPIPGFGTKRLELEYTQWLPVENFRCRYVLPLKPNLYEAQHTNEFTLDLSLQSGIPIDSFHFDGRQFLPEIRQQDDFSLTAVLRENRIQFLEDFSLEYGFRTTASHMALSTYPADPPAPDFTSISRPTGAPKSVEQDGFFQVSTLLSDPDSVPATPEARRRSVVVLMDTSLSIQWEKLERSFEAVAFLLEHLSDRDEFNLILFNRQTHDFALTLVPVSAKRVGRALDFVRESYIEDGSDLSGALNRGVEMLQRASGNDRYLILVGDGNATLGRRLSKEILDEYRRGSVAPTANMQIRLCTLGIGSDANRPLLSELALRNGGFSAWVRESEEIDFTLESFFAKLGASPMGNLTLRLSDPGFYQMIYPVDSGSAFLGSMRTWVGRYSPSLARLDASVSALYHERTLSWKASQDITLDTSHNFLPRAWAKARVDSLLRRLELEGEDEESIREIIRLSKRYKFVTPYTSFLAAPRALLRPRLIQPGDPLLRIRTDEDIESVTALFPFGLVKPMTYLPSEKVWQTRFLAPLSMTDGRYSCRLILRDVEGRTYQERKSFVIDSRPPKIQPIIPDLARPGESLILAVRADKDTRRITARLAGLPGIRLRWSPEFKSNRARMVIPTDMLPGIYDIQITAEDFAHNVSTKKHRIEIIQ